MTKTHGIESVILNHTLTRGPSVTRMRDFFLTDPFVQVYPGAVAGPGQAGDFPGTAARNHSAELLLQPN